MKLYLVETRMNAGNTAIETAEKKTLNGVFTTRDLAEKCIEEIKARHAVQRHLYTIAGPSSSICEIDADTFYEDI